MNVGDSVMVRGYENPVGSGMVTAQRLERLPATTVVAARGPYTATTAPQFKILGILVDATSAGFGGAEDHQAMTSAQFFAVAPGKIVHVRGTGSAMLMTASSATIANEQDR